MATATAGGREGKEATADAVGSRWSSTDAAMAVELSRDYYAVARRWVAAERERGRTRS